MSKTTPTEATRVARPRACANDALDATPSLRGVVERARAEYLEMPGLNLTATQAQRLWALEPGVCEAVLAALLEARFLKRTAGDAYIRSEG